MNNLPKYSITYTVGGGSIMFPHNINNITFTTPLLEYERIDDNVEKMTEFPEVMTIVNKLLQK
jgi:hypothetical protein